MHEVQVAARYAGFVPLWVQDRSGLFPVCLVNESSVRTNKLIILTINTIILINVMHTRGFVQLETHIYIHRIPSFQIATIWSVDLLQVLNAQLSVDKYLSHFIFCLLIVRRILFHGASLFFFCQRMLKWPCAPAPPAPPWMRASVMKLYIPSALIELGIDSVPHTPALPVYLDYGFCDIVNDLRFLWMFWINRSVQMWFPLILLFFFLFFLVGAILNSCSFPFRHHILHTKQISR